MKRLFRISLLCLLLLLSTLPLAHADTTFNVGLMESNAITSYSKDWNPGFALEGFLRFGRWASATAHAFYYRLRGPGKHWPGIDFMLNGHLLSEDSPLDIYIGGGVGDSVVGKTNCLDMIMRGGVDWFPFERFGATFNFGYTWVMAFNGQRTTSSGTYVYDQNYILMEGYRIDLGVRMKFW